jgi:hypothetical protein
MFERNNNMKPDDYIEKLIIDNMDELNSEEPPAGHFERFSDRLHAKSKVRTFNWQMVWKVAAVVVFVFLAVNQVRMWITPQQKETVSLAGISPEYAEVEFFYTSSIQSGIDTWNSLAATGVMSETENELMQQEFKEFERRFEEIQKEFEANPYDERVINAMLEYYQAKLSVINMIVNKLQEVKQQKIISHETEI